MNKFTKLAISVLNVDILLFDRDDEICGKADVKMSAFIYPISKHT